MRESVARRDWARFRKWRKGLQTTFASTKNIPMGMTPYPQVLESEDVPSVLVDSEWVGGLLPRASWQIKKWNHLQPSRLLGAALLVGVHRPRGPRH